MVDTLLLGSSALGISVRVRVAASISSLLWHSQRRHCVVGRRSDALLLTCMAWVRGHSLPLLLFRRESDLLWVAIFSPIIWSDAYGF